MQRLSNRRGDFRVSNGNKPSQEQPDDDEEPQSNGQNGIVTPCYIIRFFLFLQRAVHAQLGTRKKPD